MYSFILLNNNSFSNKVFYSASSKYYIAWLCIFYKGGNNLTYSLTISVFVSFVVYYFYLSPDVKESYKYKEDEE